MPHGAVLDVVDVDTGGDLSRVVLEGLLPPGGNSVRERADWIAQHGDGLRRLLLYPPLGQPDMSADLVVPASAPGAEAGFIIMEAMGYPRFSGSNAMCTATALLESGRLAMPSDGLRTVVLEAPGGCVTQVAHCRAGRVEAIDYQAEPAWVARRGCQADVPGRGRVRFDIVYGGVFYALVDAAEVDLAPEAASRAALADFGAALVQAVRPQEMPAHPVHGRSGVLHFVLFAGAARQSGPELEVPLAAYVHPGVICHGPTGTGTAALLARMHGQGDLPTGSACVTVSPEGQRFAGRIAGRTSVGVHDATEVVVTGWPGNSVRRRLALDPGQLEPAWAGLLQSSV